MLENYIQILTEGLQTKKSILDEIVILNQKQNTAANQTEFDAEEFDALMEQKGTLIDKLNGLDEGFEATYDNHKDQIQREKDHYKTEIARMQELITSILELSMEIQVQEEKNRKLVQQYFLRERESIKMRKVGQKAAINYYKTMSQSEYVEPQILDTKK